MITIEDITCNMKDEKMTEKKKKITEICRAIKMNGCKCECVAKKDGLCNRHNKNILKNKK